LTSHPASCIPSIKGARIKAVFPFSILGLPLITIAFKRIISLKIFARLHCFYLSIVERTGKVRKISESDQKKVKKISES